MESVEVVAYERIQELTYKATYYEMVGDTDKAFRLMLRRDQLVLKLDELLEQNEKGCGKNKGSQF